VGHNGGGTYKIQIAESESGPWTDLYVHVDLEDGIHIIPYLIINIYI